QGEPSVRRPEMSRFAVGATLSCWLALAVGVGCHAQPAADPSSAAPGDADDLAGLPGVDTHDLTEREKRELARYIKAFAAPCPDVAVSVGQCVREKRPCRACVPAAAAIAKAVHDGLASEQVEALYKQRFDPSAARNVPIDGSPVRGPENAPVTVVEFADFECPFCQKLAPELDALLEKRSGKVRFVYKFMPLSMHPHGESAARAAIAAQAQGKFWEMHHQLFANGTHLEDADLDTYAKGLGLDMTRFHADLQSPATKARLDADRKLADDLGVKGTPTLYVDGREYDAKIELGDWIDSEIAKAAP
ncbi:MAG: DsbA family protein, partial [Polyangiaceae bacterium]